MSNFARVMSNKTNLTFVMNPISGTVKKAGIPDIIAETLDHDRFSYRIAWTEYAGHAEVIAHREVEAGTDIVVAVGGDGTVNEVGRALIGTESALAIVPCGSGNGLARHLMLPMDIRKSIEVINQCEVHRVDYGIIGGLGLAVVFKPFELHVEGNYKYSFASMYHTNKFSDIYWMYTYPQNIMLNASLHFHLW